MPDAHGTIVGAAAAARAMVDGGLESASEAARYARSLIDVSRNPLVSIDPQGRICDANAATVEAVGIPRDQLIGGDFADCFSEPEKARAAYRMVLEERREQVQNGTVFSPRRRVATFSAARESGVATRAVESLAGGQT